ncbi:ribosomal protein S12 methylthiotransferase [Halanaerobacter jeridensis]|uniref:Ribosomal protein uS12 methylthiotransferase RimO n=2 Tax=Halanaerobacter jeridensis TaxID=706427 RepID=A0A938XR60_9FIRM|nr:30S ribosomal protein S12 methylthiotransferase RimO [Halanaerobacter jeridensis]MBM7555873.1 ribosomal protein S12 methylthiotransferase [Halanaerobacter jeridensis]
MVEVALTTLGCAKNQVDSEIMIDILESKNYKRTDDYESAEVIIVNTCGFIADAKEESIETILQLAQYKEDGNCEVLVVTGCLAQGYSDELKEEMPEIDAMLGTGNFDEILKVIEEGLAGKKNIKISEPDFNYDDYIAETTISNKNSAYVKIAEGCNNNCSYCLIPKLRGGLKSRSIENVVAEVEQLAANGIKEINVIAQDITQYGRDLDGESKLVPLLKELVQIEGIKWIRLLYAYPLHISDELIELMAQEDKICNYLDVPVQHAHQEIRRKMNRPGSKEEILAVINKLRDRIPDITLRTSIIVGFPGESEEHFQTLLDFVKEAEFDNLGAFTYSQEEGTAAAEMDCQIPEDRKEERYEKVMNLQSEISYRRNLNWIDKEVDVLVEDYQSQKPRIMIGRSQREAPEEIDGAIFIKDTTADKGEFVTVEITEAQEYDLIGVEA